VLPVVAHQFIGKGGETCQASAPPIASPTDQQFYGARTAGLSPAMPAPPALRATEDLIVTAERPKHGAALPTRPTNGETPGHGAPQAGDGMNGTEPSSARTPGSISTISSTIAQA
jgi:hypothetical protein